MPDEIFFFVPFAWLIYIYSSVYGFFLGISFFEEAIYVVFVDLLAVLLFVDVMLFLFE